MWFLHLEKKLDIKRFNRTENETLIIADNGYFHLEPDNIRYTFECVETKIFKIKEMTLYGNNMNIHKHKNETIPFYHTILKKMRKIYDVTKDIQYVEEYTDKSVDYYFRTDKIENIEAFILDLL
jgi:hypothetical protein